MELSKFKFPSFSNDIFLWVVVLFIVLGFGKAGPILGLNFLTPPPEKDCGNGKHGNDNKCEPPKAPLLIPQLGGMGNIFGSNIIFIVAVVAILFLCKDENKEKPICDDPETVEYDEVIDG
ncbi:hypothetical protein IAI10_20990 [Clostridium sp. 19966]|uniref:hypothetical protein n=1 Tax=Clostridium sp. 19966 TaxID=2768166 RepID=UPI0028DEC591|nr:hypothetical protein [Clostridium sp. 19966]MDT8719130.1 hypothetical protein [Clostridium sp. 19966]